MFLLKPTLIPHIFFLWERGTHANEQFIFKDLVVKRVEKCVLTFLWGSPTV